MSSNKKYGLILPGAAIPQTTAFQASRNVFGDDSESDDDATKKPGLLRPSQNVNRQAKIEQEKAIQEDPTVYQYDEIYDSMTTQKEQKKSKNKEENKPRYIENLLKTATKRKIENERRIERQIQKEREKEGDEFADKEVFVTSAYKKKLEEMKLEEEKDKREEYLESIGDVTKQRDLGGFYRHLYEQKLGSDKQTGDSKLSLPEERPKDSDASTTPERPQLDAFKKKHTEKIETLKKTTESSAKRNYRKRKSSSEVNKHLSEGEIDESGDEINRMNLEDIRDAKRTKKNEENIDADSDFSVNDPSEDESVPEPGDKNILDKKTEVEEPAKNADKSKTSKKKDKDKKEDIKSEEKEATPEPPPKPKIDIWKKRTEGEVFEQALQRYYERKAARGS